MWSLRVAVHIDYTTLKDSQVKRKGSTVDALSARTSQTNTCTPHYGYHENWAVALFTYFFIVQVKKILVLCMPITAYQRSNHYCFRDYTGEWIVYSAKKLFIPCSRCRGRTMGSSVVSVERAHSYTVEVKGGDSIITSLVHRAHMQLETQG